MSSVYNTSCCGVKELHGIQDESVLTSIRNACQWISNSGRAGIFTFTCNDANKGVGKSTGDILMKYILDNKLGTVTQSKIVTNRNTGNRICHYAWEFDYKACCEKYKGLSKEETARKKEMEKLHKEIPKLFPIGTLVYVPEKKHDLIISGSRFRGMAVVMRHGTVNTNNGYFIVLNLENGYTGWNVPESNTIHFKKCTKAMSKTPKALKLLRSIPTGSTGSTYAVAGSSYTPVTPF